MKIIIFVLIAILVLQVATIPYKQQIALLNALQSGRNEQPMTWACVGCDEETKPLRSHVIKEDAQDIRAIVSVYAEYTVLAFRYTATVKNVWQDLLWAIQTQDEHAPAGCKVQKQYDNMWNSIKAETLADLTASSHTKRLIITGISLGGGLAMLSYVDINHAKIFDNIELIVYGTPRVGNKNWANWIQTQTNPDPVHICIKGDPICSLPFCLTPLCNYKHAGTGYKCNKKTQVCTPSGSVNEQEVQHISYQDFVDGFVQHYSEEQQVDGILDHIYGYKKLKTYDWVV